MDTAPLPPVGHDPAPPGSGDPTDRLALVREIPGGRSRSAGLRTLEVVAGLLSGGLLLIGLALLVLQFVAPDLAPGTGLAAASGPGWWRAAAQLGIGVAGELTVAARRRCGTGVRYLLAAAVIVAAGAVLWFAWWA